MKEFSYTIKDKVGIHARPAGLLVKEASKYNSEITIKKDEKCADAKKLFSVMSLVAKTGDTIKINISGEDEVGAEKGLKEFFENNL
ncbi:MAG: HPr family phosphocarrier protein [Clostridia bacterium]|nr:HPr family phosphocarrier protein [Clostridia bacterium]